MISGIGRVQCRRLAVRDGVLGGQLITRFPLPTKVWSVWRNIVISVIGGMQCRRLAVRAGVLGGGAVPARRAAAGVGGRARRPAACARARLPGHAAHAGPGGCARCTAPEYCQATAHTTQVSAMDRTT